MGNNIVAQIVKNKLLFFIIITGSLLLLSIVIPFEKQYCLLGQCGLWLVDKIRARDDFWQIALSQASYNSFPFEFPNAAGVYLHGYHILYSMLLWILSKLLIDPIFMNGTLYPLIWIVLYTYLSIIFIRSISSSRFVQIAFIFLQFFGGSFGYFFTLFHKHSFLFSEGMTYQPILYLTNKPLSLSILLFLATIIFVVKTQKPKIFDIAILGILVFFIWGAKFHAGAAICTFIGIYYIGQYFKKHISFSKLAAIGLVCFAFTLVSIFAFYRPDLAGKSGSSPLNWAPFSLAHAIIESPDMFYLESLTNARYYLYSQGGFSTKLAAIEIFSALLYLFFTVGTRAISIISIVTKSIRCRLSILDLSMLMTILATGFLMLGFVQHADWFNTMQFFTFALIFLNVYTSESLQILVSKFKLTKYFILLLFVLLTIPFAFATAYSTLTMLPTNGLVITESELESLAYLKKLPDGVVFTPVAGSENIQKYEKDRNLWKHTDISYIASLSGKKTYLTHQYQLYLLNVDYGKRKATVENVDNINFSKINVDYIYLPKDHPDSKLVIKSLLEYKTAYRQIYENDKWIIYELL